MNINIFYSWQTATDTKYNRNFIQSCIEKAVKNLKSKPDFINVDFEILEGVSGESGSPNIANSIRDERIPKSDIFIADLSIVNQVSEINKWVQRKVFKQEFKPVLNSNVLIEHGVASNAIGVDKVIGVLNNFYGSPKNKPENFPFDLRSIRFPIEYNYSSKTIDKEKVKTQLINELTSAIKSATISALQTQKKKYSPFIIWSEWEESLIIEQNFIRNKRIEDLNKNVLEGIKDARQTIRILGLSGLGKTRILLELFRPNTQDDNSKLLSNRVLYLNCNYYPNAEFHTIFSKITSEQEERIVILDNCSTITHRQVLNFSKKENNKISFITIDSNPEEIEKDKINGVNYFIIKKDELLDVVDEILKRDFSNIVQWKIEKIKEFSQGLPIMAVLLGNSVKGGEEFIGKLDDKDLLDKLLGSMGRDEDNRTILKSCSIFTYFGFYDELRYQVEFIAKNKNITSLNGDNKVIINNFIRVCNHYLKREIFEKKGRFIGLRPFPLALSLAQEWLETCTPKILLETITDIANLEEPHRAHLAEALAEQMRYLGYNDNAKQIIDKIIGPKSPFDNAEVLNTELGSRLFRSFVEVNPEAVTQNFTRVFSSKSKEELFQIKEGRRNIIWALEKLCFDKRTFAQSAKIMFAFAVAENETWSNNATGQLLHLFHIILPGTEADLKERWKIIEWGYEHTEKEYKSIALKTMNVGLSYGHFHRMSGPETQGVKKLQDFRPSFSDVSEYWRNILNMLTIIIKSQNDDSEIATDILAKSIRSICNFGLGQIIISTVKEIVEFKNYNWDEGLEGLKYARKYEKDILTEVELKNINSLIEVLTKKDFETRYITIDKTFFLSEDISNSKDKIIEGITNLADEFINDDLSWEEYFHIFHERKQIYSYYFGKRIFELIKENKEKIEYFLNLSIKTLFNIEKDKRDPSLLGGFIENANDDIKNNFYFQLQSNLELNYLLFFLISRDKKESKNLNMLFDLIDQNKCELYNFSKFQFSNALINLNTDELNDFSEKLFKYGEEGYALVFDLFSSLSFNNQETAKNLFPIFKTCIYKLGFDKKSRFQIDRFTWSQTICTVLENEGESDFAIFINNSIINSISFENLYHLDYDAKNIYRVLIRKYFEVIWSDLSRALISNKDDEYVKFFGLKHILGSRIGSSFGSFGILFEGDIDIIFEWCNAYKLLAPIRLAELAPIYDNYNDMYSSWHPVTLRLINEFGDINEVLNSLNSNMHSYSWSGSIVPLLESNKELFNSLKDHNINSVSEWAIKNLAYLEIEINNEKNRDAEMYL